MFSILLPSRGQFTQEIPSYRDKLLTVEMKELIKKENSVNTVISSITNYLEHINGIVLNFKSISENLMTFFNDNSIYFKPFLVFSDQLRAISMNLKDHFEDFRGMDQKVSVLKNRFENLRILNKEYNEKNGRFLHYKFKLRKLVSEKQAMERKGKSLTSKKISRILRVN